MAGKGGGAWKVAYADFVTAMMAFFMVMWLVGQDSEVKEAVEQYFQHPTVQLLPAWVARGPHDEGGGSSKKYQGDDPGPNDGKGDRKSKHNRRARGQDVRHARLLVRSDGERPFTGAVVLFAEDSAELVADAKTSLDDLIPLLAGKTNRIEVRGHTARRPLTATSKFADDWQLSFARSVAVMKYLAGAGIEPQRIRLSQAGAYEPPEDSSSETLAQARVEVYVLSEFVDTSPSDGHDQAHGSHFHDESASTDEHAESGAHGEHSASQSGQAPDHGTKPKAAAKPKAKPKAKHGDSHGKAAAHGKSSGHGKSPAKKKPAAKSSHGGH